MKMIVVAFALMAIAVAAPPSSSDVPQIVRSSFEQNPAGGYAYSFETENGIVRQEDGEVKEALDEENKPHSVVVVRGSYTYPNQDGKLETITYYADETGYHAEGESIPKAPAVSARR